MAKKVECGKFLVIETTVVECLHWGGIGQCDNCTTLHPNKVYYIAVLNQWLCPKCYEIWKLSAKWYPEDEHIEIRNYNTYATILGLPNVSKC